MSEGRAADSVLNDKVVLVTGASGFIGGRAVEMLVLDHGAKVRALVRSYSSAIRLARFGRRIEIVVANMSNADDMRRAISGCDVVMHCAHETRMDTDAGEFTAMTGTRNICNAVLAAGVARLVFLSSYAVYGNALDGDLTETTLWRDADHSYTDAKRRTEQLVLEMHRMHGLPATVLQPTIVYGPFGKAWTARPVADLRTGIVPLVDGGHGYCNAVYVDDVVDSMVLAATSPRAVGEVFLISGAEPITWETYYRAFEAAIGVQSTRSVPLAEILELQAQLAREKTPGYRVVQWLRDPTFLRQVAALPGVNAVARLTKRHLSAAQRQRIAPSPRPAARPSDGGVQKALHVPNETQLGVYRPKAHVRIDKAKNYLGYAPQFDFERGMARTARFIRWANL